MAALPHLLLTVARSLPVPGLGLLVWPVSPADLLAAVPLHSALAVSLHLPDGTRQATTATVEEISEADKGPQRALLLQWAGPGELPTGATVWETHSAETTSAYQGLY